MRIHIKSKQDLNKVTHSVRASQAVLQYGVGAMVDFQDQTLVTAAPEYWTKTQRIFLPEMQEISDFIKMEEGVQREG